MQIWFECEGGKGDREFDKWGRQFPVATIAIVSYNSGFNNDYSHYFLQVICTFANTEQLWILEDTSYSKCVSIDLHIATSGAFPTHKPQQ